jgi:hypothetical protein
MDRNLNAGSWSDDKSASAPVQAPSASARARPPRALERTDGRHLLGVVMPRRQSNRRAQAVSTPGRRDHGAGGAGLSRGPPQTWRRPPRGRGATTRRHFMVGMENSAPARMPVGQRAVTVLRRV